MAAGVVVVTMTDWGRERVRLFSVGQLASRINGHVEVGRIRGNLLSGATLEYVEITDSVGHPFLSADTLKLRYSIRSLFQKHLVFSDVRIVRPVVLFDQPPGRPWNVTRIFPGDTSAVMGDTIPGFGSWVRIEDLTVVDGTIRVRRAWEPREGGDVGEAVAPDARERVVKVPGGYQSVSSFHRVNGSFPLLRLADPDSAVRVVDVDSLSMVALPFRPPAARVLDLAGRLTVSADSLGFQGVRMTLPGSRLRLDGVYAFRGPEAVDVRLRGAPVALEDLRFLRPSLPEGGGSVDVVVRRGDGTTRLVARDLDLRVEGATLAGSVDVTMGEGGTRVEEGDLRFQSLDTRTLARLADLSLPVDGVLGGDLRLAGTTEALDVNGWATLRERDGAVSRVEAEGGIVNRPGGVVARRLALRFDPLQVSVARTLRPDLPIRGTLTGRATLDGPLGGRFSVDADLVHRDAAVGRSRIAAVGDLRLEGGLVAHGLRVRFDPLQAALARAFEPDIPLRGLLTGRATLDGPLGRRFTLDADVVHEQAGVGRSHVLAAGEVDLRGGITAHELRLRLDPVQTALVREIDAGFPARGTISGRATVSGPLDALFRVDADLVHDAPGESPSHVVARGELRLAGGLVARGLRFRLDPLRASLARAFQPGLPLDGTLEGTGTLDGALPGRLAATGLDVTHRGSTGTSAITGDVRVTTGRGVERFAVDVRAHPLALATVGLFVPSAGLRGSASGSIVAAGTPDEATLDADLDVEGGGSVVARGTVGVGPSARYDVRATLTAFDAGAVTSRAPGTALTGTVDVEGVGTDPATARAVVDVALVDSELEGTPRLDSTRVVAFLDAGLATIREGRVRLASATADVDGTFGLVAGRSGELRYAVEVDALSRFADALPADSGTVLERPMQRARTLGAARADSSRVAEDHLVASVATGRPPPPPPTLDTAPPLPRDSVAGSVKAEGVLVGNVTRFDARGTATLRDVVLAGAVLGSGDVTYDVRDVLEASMEGRVEADLRGVRFAGFAFDRAAAVVTHQGAYREGGGRLDVALVQDEGREYHVSADYDLALDRRELRLERMALRFDSTIWHSTGEGAVRWAGRGVELDNIELVDGEGGRVFAEGTLPDGVPGDLRVEIASLQVAHLAALVQDTLLTRGLLSLDATLGGTSRDPTLEGRLSLVDASRLGEALPDVEATVAYADRELTARAQLVDGTRTLLDADVRIPVDLALSGRTGPRLRDAPLFADLRLDSFPLQTLPSFTRTVQDLRGRLQGEVAVRGTVSDPELQGGVALDLASVHIPASNITLREGAGAFRFVGDRIEVDSLVARSAGGTVRGSGTVDLSTLTRPVLELDVVAREATLLDDERGQIDADVDVRVTGPLDALRVEGDARIAGGEIQVPEPSRYHRATRLDDPLLTGVLDTLGIPTELRPRSPLAGVDLDLRVRIERDTWLRNSDLNIEIYTPPEEEPLRVRVHPETRELVLEGVVNTDRGDYSFAGRDLDITTGSVTFLGNARPDPLLQLSAQHEVPRRGRETLVVLVSVGGHLSEPRITLSSNVEPPLPESDLLSYLAFGRESSSLLSSEGSGIMGDALGGLGVLAEQQLAGLGLGALTDALFNAIERRGLDAGLDVFRARPAALPDEINYAAYFENTLRGVELEAGEYLGDRLFVAVQARPSEGELPGVRLEYRVPGGLLWVTRWEPRYLPTLPSFGLQDIGRSRVFGTFLLWKKRY